MQRLSLMLPILALTFGAPACDDPADEAELQALNMENGPEDLAQAEEEINDEKPSLEEFDLQANETPAAGPAGKCCKAMCSWDPGVWHQLPEPYQHPDNCNHHADWWCRHAFPGAGIHHLEDAEWRTCG
jgi:hypothetical protein